MKTLHVTLEWNEARKQWDMCSGKFFIQEFDDLKLWQKIILWIIRKLFNRYLFNCGTINGMFEGLSKTRVNKCILNLEVENG